MTIFAPKITRAIKKIENSDALLKYKYWFEQEASLLRNSSKGVSLDRLSPESRAIWLIVLRSLGFRSSSITTKYIDGVESFKPVIAEKLAALVECAISLTGASQKCQIVPDLAEVKFLFFSDTQLSYENRCKTMSEMNALINKLPGTNWPMNTSSNQPMNLECSGLIGNIDAAVFGGDLCQRGGDYSIWDQFWRNPVTYEGGSALRYIRSLFQSGDVDTSGLDPVNKLNVSPAYFGLGNHDIQSDYPPKVGWLGCDLEISRPSDFWRYQMWNFIFQMYIGGGLTCKYDSQGVDPVYPVTCIDGHKWSPNWKASSFNYKVDLGPADLYQLHRYGGDSEWGRSDGLDWLKQQLEQGGEQRAVFIVQHYTFNLNASKSIDPNWTTAQRDTLLKLLAPYNVLGLFTGHLHNVPTNILYQVGLGSDMSVSEFRPGSYGDYGAFILVNMNRISLSVAQGQYTNGSLEWVSGFGQKLQWSMSIEDIFIQVNQVQNSDSWGFLMQTSAQANQNYVVPLNITLSGCKITDIITSYTAPDAAASGSNWLVQGTDCYTLLNASSYLIFGPIFLIQDLSGGDQVCIVNKPNNGSVYVIASEYDATYPSKSPTDIWGIDISDKVYAVDDVVNCGASVCLFMQSHNSQYVTLLAPVTNGSAIQLQTVWITDQPIPAGPNVVETWVTHSDDKYYVVDSASACGSGPYLLVQNTDGPYVGLLGPSTNGLQVVYITSNSIPGVPSVGNWVTHHDDLYNVLCPMSSCGSGPCLLVQNPNGYVALLGPTTNNQGMISGLQAIYMVQGQFPNATGVTSWSTSTGDAYLSLGNVNTANGSACIFVHSNNNVALIAMTSSGASSGLLTLWSATAIPPTAAGGASWQPGAGDMYTVLKGAPNLGGDAVYLMVRNSQASNPIIALLACSNNCLTTVWVSSSVLPA